jgi:hypothetical protein
LNVTHTKTSSPTNVLLESVDPKELYTIKLVGTTLLLERLKWLWASLSQNTMHNMTNVPQLPPQDFAIKIHISNTIARDNTLDTFIIIDYLNNIYSINKHLRYPSS